MELMVLLVTILLLLAGFNTFLLLGVCSMLLKIADRLNKQEEAKQQEQEEEEAVKPQEADGVPADLLIYNPYARPPVGRLERTR
jgi:hypothetical protein